MRFALDMCCALDMRCGARWNLYHSKTDCICYNSKGKSNVTHGSAQQSLDINSLREFSICASRSICASHSICAAARDGIYVISNLPRRIYRSRKAISNFAKQNISTKRWSIRKTKTIFASKPLILPLPSLIPATVFPGLRFTSANFCVPLPPSAPIFTKQNMRKAARISSARLKLL